MAAANDGARRPRAWVGCAAALLAGVLVAVLARSVYGALAAEPADAATANRAKPAVVTHSPARPPRPVQVCRHNRDPRRVVISIRAQRLWACQRTTLVASSLVTTGMVTGGHRTPLGSWRVQAKQRDRYLVGPGYRRFVHYWMPFDGDFGLHDSSWQRMPYGSAQWRTRGSHGCIHVPARTMGWLYRWSVVGSTVVTVGN